jgi:hypothetical protein
MVAFGACAVTEKYGSRRASSCAAISSEASRPWAGPKGDFTVYGMRARLLPRGIRCRTRPKAAGRTTSPNGTKVGFAAVAEVREARKGERPRRQSPGRSCWRNDGWQLGEHVTRVMAAIPLDALQTSWLCCRLERPTGLPPMGGFEHQRSRRTATLNRNQAPRHGCGRPSPRR